jgi:hypothetical protein
MGLEGRGLKVPTAHANFVIDKPLPPLKIAQYPKLNKKHLFKRITVKPVYNGHPWNLKKWPFERGT